MSYPNIPNLTPLISITTGQTIPLLLSSIALEELALAHIMNAEAEKLQLILGTLPGGTPLSPNVVSVEQLLAADENVQRTLRDVINKEMLLGYKFQNVLDLITITPGTPPTEPCGCSVTNTAGQDFTINRGGITVTLDGLEQNGVVTYSGLFCSGCSPADNFFTFEFNATGPNPQIQDFTFEANTFTVPNCPGNAAVIITGQGTITAGTNVFGPTPTYILTIIEENIISVTISGNGNTFTASVTNVGNGEIVLSNCL